MDAVVIIFQCVNGILMFLSVYLAAVALHNQLLNRKQTMKLEQEAQTPTSSRQFVADNNNIADDRQISQTPQSYVDMSHENSNLKYGRAKQQMEQPTICWEQPTARLNDHASVSRTLLITACLLLLFSCVIHQTIYVFITNLAITSDLCNILVRLQLVFMVTSTAFEYILLWLKQKTFYNHPVIRDKSCACTQAFIWFLLIVLLLGLITITLIFFLNTSYEVRATEVVSFTNQSVFINSCQSLNSTLLPAYVPWTGTVVYSGIVLFSFFVLLAQPLLYCRVKVSSAPIVRNADVKIFPSVKRSLISACLCLLSNITAAGVAFLYNDLFFVMLCLNVSVGINLGFCALTFQNWKSHLIPCCCDSSSRGQAAPNDISKSTRDNSCTTTRTACAVSSTSDVV